jgi:hypothetical protein
MTWCDELDARGYTFLPAALGTAELARAANEWAAVCAARPADVALLGDYGARNVLDLWPAALDLLAPARDALLGALGPRAGAVRGLFFDKPPGRSWALPWHKDLSLAVREHVASAHFTKPTTKAGVPHVIAPQAVLDRMLTARVHLDPMTATNGPLRVIPGSHRAYEQKDDPRVEPAVLHCPAGAVLLMRPLLTHASGHATEPAHRRVVHIECTADPNLPDGLEWRWFVPLGLQ